MSPAYLWHLRAINLQASTVVRVKLLAIAALGLLVSCGGATVGGETTSPTSSNTTLVDGTTLPGETTTSEPGATSTLSDRQVAPDFTLQLGDGGTYTLSEGAKPVYLIFWAEW